MKKYQIFVSSTYEDLKEERSQVTKAILKLGHIPVGMELFNASDESQWKLIQRQIDDSDYYVIIVAHRYGSRDTDGKSYTEKEYDYAVSKGIPVLGFVIHPDLQWMPKFIDKGKDLESLNEFKAKVKTKMVEFWSSKEMLHALVISSISVYLNGNPGIGWIRANEAANPENVNEILRLSSENSELRNEIQALSAKSQLERKETIIRTINLIANSETNIGVKYEGDNAFSDGPIVKYVTIFRLLVPEILHEQSVAECTSSIAYGVLVHGGKLPAKEFPIATNVMRGIIANFIALDLVSTVKIKGDILYTLTTFGHEVYKEIIANKMD